jgi:hypothetical protein
MWRWASDKIIDPSPATALCDVAIDFKFSPTSNCDINHPTSIKNISAVT